MLQLLHIENIAIIECADIAFRPGFNALTGETGAGKSIVIDSISAVLGQRTSRDLIRTGADMAFVSACFADVPPRLGEDLGISWEGELLLQREIHGDGKNVCRVNGRPVTVTQLRTLGSRLLNIHGQHDGQQLLDEEQHLLYLDSFGRTEGLLTEYREKYQAMAALRRQMQALEMDEAEKARRVDTLTYQLQELERAKLRPGEEQELQSRRTLLHNAEKFISAVSGADFCLNGDDGSDGAANLVRQAQESLASVRGLDPELGELYDRLEAAYSEIYDLADTIRDKREDFDFSPQELDRVEGRLDQLYRLKKKYGPTVEEMLEYQTRCRRELDDIQDAGDTLLHLEKQLKKAEKAARQAAEALSQARGGAPVYQPLPKFPSVTRDIAVVCHEAVTVGALEEAIRKGARGLLKEVSLFDVYRGKGVDEGKKSVAFNLVLRADDRSLTSEEADEDVKSILETLKTDCDAVLR